MTQDKIRNLAIDCGADVENYLDAVITAFNEEELAAYTAAVEAPLQARIAQLEEALNDECGDRCNAEYNPCAARKVLNESSSTWLSEHDKEVVARERERIAAEIASFGDSQSIYATLAKFIRKLK